MLLFANIAYDIQISVLQNRERETIKIWSLDEQRRALSQIGISESCGYQPTVYYGTGPMSLLAAIKKLRDCS